MSLPYRARYPVIQTQTWTKLGEKEYIAFLKWMRYNQCLPSKGFIPKNVPHASENRYIRNYYARLIRALLTLYQAHLQGRA